METQYRVICNWLCLTAGDKAKKIENNLNNLSAEGWEFAAIDSVMFLGCDIGFYLVVKRQVPKK
jgi:hypothetical protein